MTTKNVSLTWVLETVFGRYSILSASKRLLPALAVPNARIEVGGTQLWKGDFDLYRNYGNLAEIAAKFECTISVFYESGTSPVWDSRFSELWFGFGEDEPLPMEEAYRRMKVEAERQQRQWLIDHGLLKEKLVKRRYKPPKEGKMAKKKATKKATKKTVKSSTKSKGAGARRK